MKTLEEIKNEVAFQKGWVDWECFKADCDCADQENIINEVAKRYATEAIKADRERVSEIESRRNIIFSGRLNAMKHKQSILNLPIVLK